ncbi:MAG: hypothetical protein QOJ07_789 [Thermoleophilaceae bacterium]|nr:hypothetical protein [Thermoleophilaceae bacterium]
MIVSHFWERGTILASAMTPVFVALLSELIKKPVQSDLVRRPLRVARTAATAQTPVRYETAENGERGPESGSTPGAVRVYSSGTRRVLESPRTRRNFKIALITGLIGFLIAAAALTLPELIFGGSVTGGHRSTTYFGGGGSSKSSSGSDQNQKDSTGGSSSSGSDSSNSSTDQTTTPKGGGSSTQTSPPPASSTPQQTSPQQTAPQQTSPAPSTPVTPPPAPSTP